MITSKTNSRIQLVRALMQDRKERDLTGQFILEGVRLVEEAVNHKADLLEVYYSKSLSERGVKLLAQCSNAGISIEEVDENVFNGLMDTSTSQGIAAVCKKSKLVLPEKLDFGVIADQLRDPGNLGTLLRLAAAAGAQAVFTTRGTVDLFSPKVVRSAMGAHFYLLCAELEWEELKEYISGQPHKHISTYLATVNGDKRYWDCDFSRPTLLIIGNEADGATKEAFEFADHHVSIPMPGQFESLNAAVAAGILIFEVVRQRTI